jgi:hypothetical protein
MSAQRDGKPLSFRADPELVAAIEREATRFGTTTSAMCRLLVEKALEQQGLEQRLRELERAVTERVKDAVHLVLLNLGQDLRQTDPRELRRLVEGNVRPSQARGSVEGA